MNLKGANVGAGIFSFINMGALLLRNGSLALDLAAVFMGALGIVSFWLAYMDEMRSVR